MKTRARRCGSHGENNDILPDFHSIEKDADRFELSDVVWTDIFGLTWHGKKDDIREFYPEMTAEEYFG